MLELQSQMLKNKKVISVDMGSIFLPHPCINNSATRDQGGRNTTYPTISVSL